MAFAENLIAVRRAHNLTQQQLAAKLFVTRQAVSRWERGEVTPGIDMMKLIAAVTGEPLSHLLEMPEHYCESCGMYLTPDDCGTDASGKKTDHYCKWCYEHGEYTYETTMEAMIEDCAPRLAENTGMTLDEAVAYFDANAPRGEFVLILEGAPDEPETEQDEAKRLASAAEAVRRRMEQGQTQKDAVKAVSAETGVKKNALYRYVLENE